MLLKFLEQSCIVILIQEYWFFFICCVISVMLTSFGNSCLIDTISSSRVGLKSHQTGHRSYQGQFLRVR